MKYTFRKIEHLCSKKDIETLYRKGRGKTAFPVKVMFLPAGPESPVPAQVLITVPKRKIRQAVNRNLLKRRIREAYRHAKPAFYEALEAKEQKLHLMFIYLADTPLPYENIRQSVEKLLTFIGTEIRTSGKIKPE